MSGPIALVYAATAVFFSLWYLYTSGFGLVSTESNRGIYLMLTSVLVFLLYPALPSSPKTRPSLFDVIWVVAAFVSVGYWIDQYTDYAINRVSDPNQWDFVMGVIGIAVMLETSRRVLGITVVIIALAFLAQLYFGKYLPGKLAHSGLGLTRIVEFTFSTQEAMFGVVAATFATFVFPFMIFGAFLGAQRRRPVLHGPRHLARRQMARRPRQDRRHHLRAVRLDLRLLGRQRGLHRHLHHSADETPRLQAAPCRRHRGHRLDRRPVHAADHGRRRVHSGDADGNRIPQDRADERDPGVPLFLLPAVHGRPAGAQEPA